MIEDFVNDSPDVWCELAGYPVTPLGVAFDEGYFRFHIGTSRDIWYLEVKEEFSVVTEEFTFIFYKGLYPSKRRVLDSGLNYDVFLDKEQSSYVYTIEFKHGDPCGVFVDIARQQEIIFT